MTKLDLRRGNDPRTDEAIIELSALTVGKEKIVVVLPAVAERAVVAKALRSMADRLDQALV